MVLARIVEASARAGDELLDRARHHHLRGAGEGAHARADVHRDPAQRPVELLDLAGVDADADVDPDVLHGGGNRRRRAQRLGRLGEGGEEAVSFGALLAPAVTFQLLPDGGPEAREHDPPACVTELMGQCRRPHDVEEQHRHEAAARTRSRHAAIISHAALPS